MFEDGVIVEGIDIGEKPSVLIADDELNSLQGSKKDVDKNQISQIPQAIEKSIALSQSALKQQNPNIARKTDDVYTFLQTVDLAGIPDNMAIAFLNDPERQHALSYLRKQMMLSNPQECMLCQLPFTRGVSEIRFCPCCAMVSCSGCVSKRVFEVVSRSVVSVCVHCYRESSRIFQPPQAVQDTSNINEELIGKWWRPEELGLVDYSSTGSANATTIRHPSAAGSNSAQVESMYNDKDELVLTSSLRPLIPGLLDGLEGSEGTCTGGVSGTIPLQSEVPPQTTPDGEESNNSPVSSPNPRGSVDTVKFAKCKSCGLLISRDIELIEAHMSECSKSHSPTPTKSSNKGGFLRASLASISEPKSYTINSDNSSINIHHGNHKQFAGIMRNHDIARKFNTRVIYRTARNTSSTSVLPREITAFQDCFLDEDGSAYVYEISVRHSEVKGLPDYVTANVMLSLYVARPIRGNKTASTITIISQVDPRMNETGISWWGGDDLSTHSITGLRREDLVRELKQCGDLPNLLNGSGNCDDEDGTNVSLDDFELLAVLGRGGFGKVMQVRHKGSNAIYAMKILKKSELCRKRQVERTQTERTILANVRHPFIVQLHYAFQNAQKLYMVMDFVQGGDFFTLMHKFRRLNEDWVRLYILQIAMALQHLHDREIVYRDLKPENILFCADGYLKLTDFGLSRYFETRPPAAEDIVEEEGGQQGPITRSFCGTEQYMSPEMLLQQGHNYRMDWWCLGLLMHEMISGRHPFHGATHYDTLRNMVTRPPSLDSRLSPSAANIVRSLLIKNPKSRLGGKDGINELKNLSFFNTVNWDDLYHKRIPMPHVPSLQGETDISSFETTFTKERAVDSIPGPDPRGNNDKKKGGGFFSLFTGNNASGKNKNGDPGEDAFKGFSFNKEELNKEASQNTPTSAPQNTATVAESS